MPSTYLNGENLAIALETGAVRFTRAAVPLEVRIRAPSDAGIAWLGPASGVIDALGDKDPGRVIAERCGVAPVPGIVHDP